MSQLTQAQAQDVFNQYIKAEEDGNDGLAISLEKDLNDANWFIVSGKDGLTIKQKGGSNFTFNYDPSLLPTESNVKPLTPDTPTENSGRKFWITAGIIAGAAALTFAIIWLIKRYRNANS